MEVTLSATARPEKGKGPARRARMAGRIPGVLYGRSLDPVPLSVDAKAIQHALHTEAGGNVMINLDLDGRRFLAVPREVQRHPIRGTILHVDFVNIARDEPITASVPIQLVGDAHGVRMGGILEQHLRDLNVQALPSRVPTSIEVDVTDLDVAQTLRVGDVPAPDGVEVLTPADEVVVSVVEPAGAQPAAEAGEETGAAEETAGGETAPAE